MTDRKMKNRRGISFSIFRMIVFFTLITTALICAVTYTCIIRVFYKKNMKSYIEETHWYYQNDFEGFAASVSAQSLDIVNDNGIYEHLLNKNTDEEERRQIIYDTVLKKLDNDGYIECVDILCDDGRQYRVSRGAEITEKTSGAFIAGAGDFNLYLSGEVAKDTDGEKYVVFGKKMVNYYTGISVGQILMYVREEDISTVYNDLSFEQNKVFLINNDVILSSNEKRIVGNYVPEDYFEAYKLNKKVLCDYCTIDKYGLKIEMVVIIPHSYLYASLYSFTKQMLVAMLAVCVLIMIIAYFISKRLVESIIHLNMQMTKYANGERVTFLPKSADEIGMLSQKFENLTTEIDSLIQKNNEEKQRSREFELSALQSQINPHFVYNTINTIKGMALLRNETEISNACVAFSNFFRISLNYGNDIVSVREEMIHVQSYLEIERLRFGDKFDVVYNISPEIQKLNMLKILIQPLAENAVKHGFNGINYKGLIQIEAHTEGDNLVFSVTDNGVGINEEEMFAEKKGKKSYGIFNVNERIRLFYGNDCGVKYIPQSKGVKAVVTIKKAIG